MNNIRRSRSELTHEQIVEIFSRIETFDYNGTQIRVVEHSGQRWMVFADVCKVFGYKNPSHQSKYLDSDEKCHLDIGLKNGLAICINERGLKYFAVISGRQAATEFYNWTISAGVFTAKRR